MNKKILLASIFTLILSATAFADDPLTSTGSGVFIGGQLGMSDMHYSGTVYLLPTNDVESRKFAGRFYAGYSFTDFIAAELGYGYYGSPVIKDKATGNTQDFIQQGLDLLCKISIPLDYGFSFYLKGGANLVHRGALTNRGGLFTDQNAHYKVAPEATIGAAYFFIPNMGLDISASRTFKNGSLPNMDFFALGFIYKFNF
ncbi:MAG: outer membrane beta-barrel protein [Gammaproteobacteria bacterium]|nr:outer membrane beta-barrel protein [Gammaproteobacteria bacterium]